MGALSGNSWMTNSPPFCILTVAKYCFDLSMVIGGAALHCLTPFCVKGVGSAPGEAGEAGADGVAARTASQMAATMSNTITTIPAHWIGSRRGGKPRCAFFVRVIFLRAI